MLIEIDGITKKYGKKQILNGVSFGVESGECIGILGSNGCGKSTLLSVLAGVQKAESGRFLWDGADMFADKALHRAKIGYVPQGTPLIEELTAKDNLRLWYGATQLEKELKSGVAAMLGVGDFLKVAVCKMSGGMKKRLSIACAVAAHPQLLLLDEPCAALDILCRQNILSYLAEHKKAGGALVMVTHDPLELSLCDRCFILKDGKLTPFEYDSDINKLAQSI